MKKNTIFQLTLIDVYALKEALEESGGPIQSVSIEELSADNRSLQMIVYYSRYATDGNGSHVGYEDVIFSTTCLNRLELGLHAGIPMGLSEWVVNPNSFKIDRTDLPKPDIFKEGEDEDNDNGYCPPDNDFFYEELDYIINHLIDSDSIPAAEFDPVNREWSIGNQKTWKIK